MKIFDLHCDTLDRLESTKACFTDAKGHIYETALQQGGYIAQCFAVYQPAEITGEEGRLRFTKQCGQFCRMINSSSHLRAARTAADIRQNNRKGCISALLTVENADFLQNDLQRLDMVVSNGVTLLGLVHNGENCLGYPHSSSVKANSLPLKPFGREVIDKLNSTPILADVSHLNAGGLQEVASLSKKPFIATHSGCRAVWDHSRNLYDNQIRAIARSGGVVGLVFYSRFLNGTHATHIEDILRHLSHLIRVGGEEVAALGSDFDGMDCRLFLKDAGGMQRLAEAITATFGFSLAEKICYKNAMRIFK